jgi:protein gp37
VGATTAIAWTSATFSPWWGCQTVSEACRFCYAEAFAKRVGHGKRLPQIWGGESTQRRMMSDAHWKDPIRWDAKAHANGEPMRVFSGSMCDVFERRADLEAPLARLLRLIRRTPYLTWQLLTKRPENITPLLRLTMETAEYDDRHWLAVGRSCRHHLGHRIHAPPRRRRVPSPGHGRRL